MRYFFWITAGYLSGSILFAYFLPLWLKQIDVRTLSDDGNPGTANAFKYAGIPIGMLVILCELGKGFVPVFLAARRLDVTASMFAFVLASPVLGHAMPLGMGRKNGGKAIAVSFGVLLGLLPEWRPVLILICYYLLFSLVIVIQPHFYRSILTFFCFTLTCMVRVESRAVIGGCILLSLLVIVKHLERYQGEHLKINLWQRRESNGSV